MNQSIAATKSPSERGLLPLVLLSLALVVAAVPALNVALPNVAADTHASNSQLQWIVDAYALVFAGLLLPAGALGDRYGRKPVLIVGLAVFALASATASFMTDAEALMAARGVMGVGAALVMPTTLSIITTSFPPEQRRRAVGAWVGVAGAGAVFGLLTSGSLLEFWDWQSVFLFNAILAAIVAGAAVRKVPNSRATDRPHVDYLGGLLSVVALAGLVFAAIEAPDRGWDDPLTLASIGTGLIGLALWVTWGFVATEPLLDPRLFRNRAFSTGVLSITLQFFVFFGYIFVIVQYLQLVLGYSPLQAGLALAPMAMILGGLSRRVPHLLEKVGRRPLAIAGLLLMALGTLVLAQLGPDSSYWSVLAGILPIGVGMALATSPATTDIVSALPAHKQGVASAVNDAAREVGGTLGIALLGSVLNGHYRSGLADSAPAGAPHSLVAGAQQSLAAALGLVSPAGDNGWELADAARLAFTGGAADAFYVAGGLLCLGALVLAFMIPVTEEVRRPAAVAPALEVEPAPERETLRSRAEVPASRIPSSAGSASTQHARVRPDETIAE
jgi:EmrB/QacA subfamily drug resistance transporter